MSVETDEVAFNRRLKTALIKTERPDLGMDVRRIDEEFHRRIYHAGSPWIESRWMGRRIFKNPCDLMMFQEIIYEQRPDLIIECGTLHGGSTLFLAQMCELVGNGGVISIDRTPFSERGNMPYHPRLRYVEASSLDPAVLQMIHDNSWSKNVLVDLDSDHHKDHVLAEMEAYAEFVTPGSYMVVEDTNINGHPVAGYHGPGPWEAVEEFLKRHEDFLPDPLREKYFVTWSPRGWLRRKQ